MFSVKATYRNETRRFTFSDAVLFPTYDQLHHELYRIFSISHDHYLARLIFSPDALKPGRILVGKEVHSAEEYDRRVAPLRRLWPNPLLRFTIYDDTPHEAPSGAPERWSLYSDFTVPSSEVMSNLPSPAPPHNDTSSFTLPPPPPPQPSAPSKSHSRDECATAGTAPRCSITQAKADVQVLLSSFKEDLERILCRTLGTDHVEKPPSANANGSTASLVDLVPPQTESPARASVDTSRWCFVCKTSFTGVWYGCIKCPWHAICPGCFAKSHSAHTLSFGPSHIVQQRPVDGSTQVSARTVRENSTSGIPQPVPTSSGPAGEPELPVHRGVVCDSCNKVIVGVRHKCLDCLNYDLCATCVESGATEQHNPFHEFFDIEMPGHVYVHTALGGERDSSFVNCQQQSSSDHIPQGLSGTPADLPVRHAATCNLCDSGILGERYKCVVCPDFDTCSSCFRITTEQHPSHGFVKVGKPEDLMMRDSLALRQAAHLAICDSCRKTIRGARFKCMHPHCPDFDLCSDCEALPIPVHPLNHPMLKLRTSDTVMPAIYRERRTQTIGEPTGQKPALVCGGSRSPILLPTSPLATPTRSPETRPAAVSGQVTNMTVDDQSPFAEEFLSPLGSPASEVPGTAPTSVTIVPSHLLVDISDSTGSPRSVHPVLDQLWPRVNQEMIHLNAMEAPTTALVVNASGDTITDPIRLESPVAKKLLTNSPAASFIYQAGECRGASPVPSTKSIVGGYRTPSSTPSNFQELHCITQPPDSDQREIVTTNAPPQRCLDSIFVGDTNVPDGQIFPPGAEFVKGWHMMNNGKLPWPATTEVQFVAGEMFASECSTALKARVGVVHSGQDVEVWTGDLKAPDVPGRYVGYWRLSDGQGNFFGNSVWIDLTVADHHSDQASEESLAASSMIMPSAHPIGSANVSDELQDAPQPSLPSTKTVTDEIEDPESEISSVSLVSVPTSDDEDAEWQDTRTHSEPLEYVVLYDGNSEE